MPANRPDLRFSDDGICSACSAFDARSAVDWNEKAEQFAVLMREHRGSHPAYDCIVASSGGKDSHFIALKMRELGYRPLLVTATTDIPTQLGRANLLNLREQGFDSIEVTPNPIIRRKLNRISLEIVGDPEWPEHRLIWATPSRIAKEMGIGVVLYGEVPENEYSGGAQDAIRLTKRWASEYGGELGLRPADLFGVAGITEADMWPYQHADAEDIWALFLGAFYPWDGWRNAMIAQAHGFRPYGAFVEGNVSESENLDNALIGIHYDLGFMKYGFGRATVIASLHVRRGRLTRDEAVTLARKFDGQYPESYLGLSIEEILAHIGMTRKQYDEARDHFANTSILEKDQRGNWKLKEPIV